MTNISIGEGSMIYTALYQELNGDYRSDIVSGNPDKFLAWEQGQRYFKRRLIALIPGNHSVVTEKGLS